MDIPGTDLSLLRLDSIEKIRAQANTDTTPRVEPPNPPSRKLEIVLPIDRPNRASGTLAEAREAIPRAIEEYLMIDEPEEILLIKALPGTGKTTAAAAAAERLAALGKRVAYAGPRHDFFRQVLEKAEHPEWWYEWQPRQEYDEAKAKPETCRYTRPITTWMYRGYQGIDFCSRVCGWDYINQRCPYHAQKGRKEPIIFVQHQHLTLGHPLDFNVMIGDESPVQSFLNDWSVPRGFILPPGLPNDEPVKHILEAMRQVADSEKYLGGEGLINELGGADYVLQACEGYTMIAGVEALVPEIHHSNEAENAPYFHLPSTLALLEREARAVKSGEECPHRLILNKGELRLLLRRRADLNWTGKHVIWLDATGEERIYQELFGRSVRVVDVEPHIHGRIYQVVDRTNAKTTIIDKDSNAITPKGGELEQQVRQIVKKYGYQDPVVISYQKFVEQSEVLAGIKRAHFYAARGTNEYESCDAVIVAGMPRPSVVGIDRLAKMIFFDRDQAFLFKKFYDKAVQYDYIDGDGMGRAYPVTNFWEDDDLRAVLKMLREDEILQAAHRGRPVNRAVDIWLLLNAPIDGLPPDELLTIRELMGAPEGSRAFSFVNFRDTARKMLKPHLLISAQEIMEATGISENTYRKYRNDLVSGGLVKVISIVQGRGRPKEFLEWIGPYEEDYSANTY